MRFDSAFLSWVSSSISIVLCLSCSLSFYTHQQSPIMSPPTNLNENELNFMNTHYFIVLNISSILFFKWLIRKLQNHSINYFISHFYSKHISLMSTKQPKIISSFCECIWIHMFYYSTSSLIYFCHIITLSLTWSESIDIYK